jgi:hypothetical protein
LVIAIALHTNPATIILEKGSTLTGDDYVRIEVFNKEMAKLQQSDLIKISHNNKGTQSNSLLVMCLLF